MTSYARLAPTNGFVEKFDIKTNESSIKLRDFTKSKQICFGFVIWLQRTTRLVPSAILQTNRLFDYYGLSFYFLRHDENCY